MKFVSWVKSKNDLVLVLRNRCNIQFQYRAYGRVEIVIQKGLKGLGGSHTDQTIIGILKKAAKNSNIIIFSWDSRMAMLIIYRSANDIALSSNIHQIANPMETHSTLSSQSCL